MSLRFVLSAICTLAGVFALISGVVGVFRFKYALNRMHAAALIDSAGIFLMLLGLIIAQGFTIASGKMVVIIAILWLTSPVSSHLLARMQMVTDEHLEEDVHIKDAESIRREKEEY